ncbi:MAG: cyclin, partial [Chitinophagales bacterium]
FLAADLTPEIGIIALIYVERLLLKTNISLYSLNVYRVLIGATILASKVWDDQAVWNIDFKGILPDLA